MSAIGTKRTWADALHMSAFGGKADMTLAAAIGGEADIPFAPHVSASDPKRPSVHCTALSMLRPFYVDGISRKQHLFLCLKGQEVGILRRYQ